MIITTDTRFHTNYSTAVEDVNIALGDNTVIEDDVALAIAAAWQSPFSTLATLASTGKANADRLLADTEREQAALDLMSEDYAQDMRMLDALVNWIAFKVRQGE